VLVGAAGSGKTTLAARAFSPDEVLSSDAYREIVSGDPSDQAATKAAFAALHRALIRRLHERRLTVVDATNVKAHARRALLRRAASADVPVVAIVLDLPGSLVVARNASRSERIVPEAAVRGQLEDLRSALRDGLLETEGFRAVHVLRTPGELEGLRIERTPPGA
jgi:protein phosphatase